LDDPPTFGFVVPLRGPIALKEKKLLYCLIKYCIIICHGLHTQKQGGGRRQVDETVYTLDYFNNRARYTTGESHGVRIISVP
jgi:hypothetical protein